MLCITKIDRCHEEENNHELTKIDRCHEEENNHEHGALGGRAGLRASVGRGEGRHLCVCIYVLLCVYSTV